MKKSVWILAVVACWLLSGLSVKADLIWEPYHDDFYEENRVNCDYVNRTFSANGPDGEVILYESPKNPTVVATWKNGFTAYISFTYTDAEGNVWGVYEDMESGINGWMPMAYMTVVYDFISFQEEHADNIMEESGTIPAMYAGQSIRFWKYPGAEDFYEVPMPEDAEGMPQYNKVYEDEAGQWGYIGYYRGNKNRWVCLANATGDLNSLYSEGAPQVGMQQSEAFVTTEEEIVVPTEDESRDDDGKDTSSERIEPEKDNGLIGLVIGLVVAVTGATGGALVWLKKKSK